MAAEAFDPFANDDDEIVALSRDASRVSPRSSPRSSPRRYASHVAASGPNPHDVSSNANYVRNSIQTDDIMKEFNTAFPSMTLGDDATDQFGFPANVFPATFSAGVDDTYTKGDVSHKQRPVTSNLEGVTFVIAEEMSVIHKSQTNQCSVKVRGNVSVSEIQSSCLKWYYLFHIQFLNNCICCAAGGIFTYRTWSTNILRCIFSRSQRTYGCRNIKELRLR